MADTRTKVYFDNKAVSFDSIYLNETPLEKIFNKFFRKAVYERFEFALHESGDVRNKTVLDIGCGSGRYMVEYAKRGASKVIGIDFSENMLKLASELLNQEKVIDKCELIKGDFLTRTFAEKVDIIVAMGLFDYVSDPVKFMKKIVTVSRGVILASFPAPSLLRSRIRSLRYRMQNCPLYLYDDKMISGIAEASGIRNYQLQYIRHSGQGYFFRGHVNNDIA